MKNDKSKSNQGGHPSLGISKLTSAGKALLPIFLLLTPILPFTPVMAQEAEEVPFFLEDFEDGDAADGNPVTWEIDPSSGARTLGEVVDGSYVLSSTGRYNLFAEEFDSIGDVSIRVLVRRLSQESHSILLAARVQTDGSGKAYMASISDEGLVIWYVDGVNPMPNMLNFKFDSAFNAFNRDINIQFDVVGDGVGSKLSLTAWPLGFAKPSRPQITYKTPGQLPPGKVGINTQAGEIAIRSFHAIRIGNSAPPPTLKWESADGNILRFTVPTGYVLQSSPSMDSLDWSDVEGSGSLELIASDNVRFFRLCRSFPYQ